MGISNVVICIRPYLYGRHRMKGLIMKKRTQFGLGLLGVIAANGIVATLNSKESNEERMKRLISKTWDSVKDEMVDVLGLKQMPVLDWDVKDGAIMYVSIMFKFHVGVVSKTIVETETDYIIHINLKEVIRTINSYKAEAFYMSKSLTTLVIKQLLYHECRHIWQAQGNFYVGTERSMFDLVSFNGYGSAPEELDANKFAYSMAKSKKERVLSLLQKKKQEEIGKLFHSSIDKEYKAFVKEFNPILKWFIGA